jgi:heterodisulfide reductase subunit A-like polyferredoxin
MNISNHSHWEFYTEPERKIPITHNEDVAVVGGGTAGCISAIAAARMGATVVLIERFASLGGCATTGRCFHIGNLIYNKHKIPYIPPMH